MTNHTTPHRRNSKLCQRIGLAASAAFPLITTWLLASSLLHLTQCAAQAAEQSPLGRQRASQVSKTVKVRPTRMPLTRFPTRLPPTRLLTTGATHEPQGRSGATLLAPEPIEIVVDERIPKTVFDRPSFDRSISATLASGWHARDRRLLSEEQGIRELGCEQKPCLDFYNDFSPTPIPQGSLLTDPFREEWAYDSKCDIPTQRPWIEWGRNFYGNGVTPRGWNCFGCKNLVRPEFYVYGDFRSGLATGRNAVGRTDNWANRLNLDTDLKVTDTGRFHSFIGPLDDGADVTRWDFVDGDAKYRDRINLTPVTAFFEGDVGAMLGTAFNQTSPFELPVSAGLLPLLFQNGIWMEDAVSGLAFAIPARHSRILNWSSYDATFFAVFDQLNSLAFGADDHAAQAFGTAWFIEAYHGYIESGYAYVHDRQHQGRSYHNITTSYTRRYFDRISNSLRVIVNTGQDLPSAARTADGVLLLVENSWITPMPLRVVPYANFFVGWDRPQSVARAGVSGGILRNTGINFDTDGVNGFATLDPTASDTAGGSVGIDLLGAELDHQLLLELSYLTPHGSKNPLVPDDQYAVGSRYQFPISNSTLLRFDVMYGWRQGLEDVYGTRMEYRWKF